MLKHRAPNTHALIQRKSAATQVSRRSATAPALSDLPSFQAYRSISELGRYQGWSPISEAEAMAFLAEMKEAPLFTPGQWVQLGIAEPEADRLIGDIGIFLSDDGLTGEVGFTLEPVAQGRGIAASAVREALQLLFESTSVQSSHHS